MNTKLVYATIYVASALGTTSTLFVDVMGSTGEDPRSEAACDKMVDREAFQDSRTEFDSNIPDSDQGSQKAHEGSLKAMGDCPFAP
jgi:hypothetical protein